MKKRITSMVFSIIIMLMLFSIALPINATSDMRLVVDLNKTSIVRGDTVTCTVSIENADNLGILEFGLLIPEGITIKEESIVIPDGVAEKMDSDGEIASPSSINDYVWSYSAQDVGYTDTDALVILTFDCIIDDTAEYKENKLNLHVYDCLKNNMEDHTYVVTPATVTVVNPVQSVTLDKNTATVQRGGNVQLNATLHPLDDTADATNKNISWESDAEGVATVDSTGKVTAVAPGTAKITVTTEDGNKTASCEVTVTAVPVSSVTLNKENASIKVGEKVPLTATVKPDTADNKAISWKSSDSTIATVYNGEVTGVKAGEATITATAADGSGKYAQCVVTVSNEPVTGITISAEGDKTEVTVGEYLQLTATVAPDDATIQTLTWTSSDNTLATVDTNGKVYAKAPGNVTITAAATDESGVFDTYDITVKPVPDCRIELDKSEHTFASQIAGYTAAPDAITVTVSNVGNQLTGDLEVTLSGANPAAFTVTPASLGNIDVSDNASFTVRPVTGLAAGTYTATVKVDNENLVEKTLTVSFTVEAAVKKVELSQKSAYAFDSKIAGYYTDSDLPAALEVTVTNVGNLPTGPLTVSLTGDDGSFEIDGASIGSLGVTDNKTATFTIQPIVGLAAKTHTATVQVGGDGVTGASFDVSFVVVPAEKKITLSQTEDYEFEAEYVKYPVLPDGLVVTVKNVGNVPTGDLTATLSGTHADNFTVIDGTIGSLAANNGTKQFTVQPKTNLDIGTYTATVTVADGTVEAKSFDVSFTVKENIPVLEDGEDLTTGTEIDVEVPSDNQTTGATFTLTNKGNEEFAFDVICSNSNFVVSYEAKTFDGHTVYEINIKPNEALAEADYVVPVVIIVNGVDTNVSVNFTVAHVHKFDNDHFFPAVQASCISYGSKAYYQCTTCYKYFDSNDTATMNEITDLSTWNEGVYGPHNDSDDDGVCNLCGYKMKNGAVAIWYGFLMRYVVNVETTVGGTVDAAEEVLVRFCQNRTFTITPDEGYEIISVIIDGVDMGPITEYTLEKVTDEHKISVIFGEIKAPEADPEVEIEIEVEAEA